MVGAGRIFEAYRDGELEDDDEVAVAHAGPEDGYRATSEAMVNIRATLTAAEEAGCIRAETCARLVAQAKTVYYPLRGYGMLLARVTRLA